MATAHPLDRRTVYRTVAALIVLLWAGAGQAAPTTTPDPLGATPHGNSTTFRVWAPFVQAVAVQVNGHTPVPMSQESGHPDPGDTTWDAVVPGAKPGDHYTYRMQFQGTTRGFNDPYARQLAGAGADTTSVITAPVSPLPAFPEPTFNTLVIYEMHIGTFHPSSKTHQYTFAGAAEKLDYLEKLGVNAVELMPVHDNAPGRGHTPADFDWGYDATHLFAINPSYGTPRDFRDFVRRCHEHHLAVILDVVYNHLTRRNLLEQFDGFSEPAVPEGVYFYGGAREDSGFGPRPDFGRPQVRKYIEDSALMWLREDGVDGLRWDSVVNIRAFGRGHQPIAEGAQMLREANDAYRAAQPGKISIAEDLQGAWDVTTHTSQGGLGFNSQWDDGFIGAVRDAVTAVHDEDRDVNAVARVIGTKFGDDVFHRVIYSEDHDQVGHPQNGQIRLPALIDRNDPQSVFAKRRSTLAAALALTSPGIPMLFQGQEMLDSREFDFGRATDVDWTLPAKFPGIVHLYQDLIALRRNERHTTGGLTFQNCNVFHVDPQNHTLAYHRYGDGGPGDDVVVVVNLSAQTQPGLPIGFPRSGTWRVRFNSGASAYDSAFTNGNSFDTIAQPGAQDGLNFHGNVGVGPYSVVILSQDRH